MVDMSFHWQAAEKAELRTWLDKLQDDVRQRQQELDHRKLILERAHYKWERMVGASLPEYVYEK